MGFGFFADGGKEKRGPRGLPSADLLHKLECKACPLDRIKENQNAHMKPTGSKRPLVYMLGEAPGKDEDQFNRQFVGDSGQLLRARVPPIYVNRLRWNNVVRTRPVDNATPTFVEIECCRPSIIRDIEETKPKAIFGFGGVPLNWISGQSGILKWRGRRMPVRVGSHACWFYPMLHPSYILRTRAWEVHGDGVGSEQERAFRFDLERAFAEIEHLDDARPHDSAKAADKVEIITSHKAGDLDRIIDALYEAAGEKYVGIDYETNGLRPYGRGKKILTVAIASKHRAVAFPFEHPGARWTTEQFFKLTDAWRVFLAVKTMHKVVHHLAFEMEWTAEFHGKKLLRAAPWEDTMSQAFVLDERVGDHKPGCFALEFLVQQYFGFNLKALSKLDREHLDKAPLEDVLRYNGLDAKYHRLLFLAQRERIFEDGLENSYKMMLRRVPTVVLTQLKGVPVDQKVVVQLQDKYKKRIAKIEKEIAALPEAIKFKRRFGAAFSPLSNQDAVKMLKDIMQCYAGFNHEKTGGYSVDESVLSQIDHPLPKLLLELRKATKRKSTYIDPLAKGSPVLHEDGRLHPILSTTNAETGRLASQDPNEQNFPKRNEEAREVRKQIRPM